MKTKRQKAGIVLKPSSLRKILHLAHVTPRIPHMSICGALPLSVGPPFGALLEVYIPGIPSYKTLLTHQTIVQCSLPCLLSSLPASMSSKTFYLLQAECCLGGGAGKTNGYRT